MKVVNNAIKSCSRCGATGSACLQCDGIKSCLVDFRSVNHHVEIDTQAMTSPGDHQCR
jgi:hypothetical protein